MQKIQKLFLIGLFFILSISNVEAACTNEETSKIRNEAVQVKTSYEKKTRVLDKDEYGLPDGTPPDADVEITEDYFEVYINNLTDNLYVTVYNDATKETITYNYQNSNNGTISFKWERINQIVDYTITVYSSSKTGCADTQLYQTNLKLPRYNSYSLENICNNAGDFYLCHEYVTVDEVDYPTFNKRVQSYLNGQVDINGEEKKEESKKEDKKNSGIIIGTICVIIVAAGVGTVIIVKKQRRNKNEKN